MPGWPRWVESRSRCEREVAREALVRLFSLLRGDALMRLTGAY